MKVPRITRGTSRNSMTEVFHITITLKQGERTIVFSCEEPILLSSVFKTIGISHKEPCGGNGRCGKCLVYASGDLSPLAVQEQILLTEEDKRNGLRLACLAKVIGNVVVRLPEEKKEHILMQGTMHSFERLPWGKSFGIAVDIGTTTIVTYLLQLETGTCFAQCSELNPQNLFGADVISRMAHAIAGEGKELHHLVINCINTLIQTLCRGAAIEIDAITCAVITGNTTMLFLLCEEPVNSLAVFPFIPNRYFGEMLTPAQLGLFLSPDTKIYLPRCISAYVGADITTGIIASGLFEAQKATLLVDIGTNGEMVLQVNQKMLCCATAAGPAFEGAGIKMGSSAVPGAIHAVTLLDGKLICSTIGKLTPSSICGSGIVDALAALLEMGVVTEGGRIEEEKAEAADILSLSDGELALRIDGEVILTQKDIRAIQLAKAAICAGMYTLIHHSDITEDELDTIFLAGGFGTYMNIASAAAIGLIPPLLAPKAKLIGNSAGIGAAMLLQSSKLLFQSELTARQAETIELSTDAFFMNKYIDCMLF
ncbi:MAG: ferredoxin [Firmicutes bacterium]|nr:ferredoxin [Bacillota bacterium]